MCSVSSVLLGDPNPENRDTGNVKTTRSVIS
jgi:hypothetical protein